MGELKRKWRNLPLRTFFMLTVLMTFVIIFLLSGLIIWGCAAFRHYLLPDSDSVYLSIQKTFENGNETIESHLLRLDDIPVQLPQIVSDPPSEESQNQAPRYSIEKIEPSYQRLSPKRKLAYTVCGVTMAAAPAALSLAGIILCSLYFYRRKLKLPLQLLTEATAQMAVKNLDFRPDYDCGDEMGQLCRSFVQMQEALHANNREMWAMLEERRNLQASVAHDLRNPIAILQGYGEHLENKALRGDLAPENVLRIARNIRLSAKRMANYAESLHRLNQLEDIVPEKLELAARELAADLTEDFSLMAQQSHRDLHVSFGKREPGGFSPSKAPSRAGEVYVLPDISVWADRTLLYRSLENIMGNALRFSRKDLFMELSLESGFFSITVRDDGEGFPEQVLQKSGKTFFPAPSSSASSSHMGIGIAISRILCHRHGGTLRLSNPPEGGAMAEMTFDVSPACSMPMELSLAVPKPFIKQS